MEPQHEIGKTHLAGEENKLAELERQKTKSKLRLIADSEMPFDLFSSRVRWKLSKKTSCTTSNKAKTIVADENCYLIIASRAFV
jgi:hypothetical protein